MPTYHSRILTVLLLYLHVSISAALTPAGTYTVDPVALHSSAKLWHRIDQPSRTAYLALLVNDTTLPAASGAAWIGLGISEPTSGSMLGSDVVNAEFAPSATIECTLTDRHVPFFAYQIGSSTPDSPSAFPDADDCQDDGSWVLVRCERDTTKGEIILEVSRSLEAHDTQDRDIVEGLNSVIHAYGGNFGYHGARRASTQVVFYEKGSSPGEPLDAVPPLPGDVDGFVEIRATNYTVPHFVDTVYACTSKVFELEGDANRMVVAAEHVIDSPKDMVHHLTLSICSGEAYAKKIARTIECDSAFDTGIDGPLGSNYVSYIISSSKMQREWEDLCFPEKRDFAYRNRAFIVMESHYDNPDKTAGNVDRSGVRIYYTNTMRDNDAGSLIIGDSGVNRFGDVVKTDFEYEHGCPSDCTEKLGEKINMFGSFLHMHTTGREIYTNKFSKNGTFVETVNKVNFWSDNFQKYVFYDPPLLLSPGEQLQTTCLYDTRKRPNTVFGLATKDEMCMNFIGYWPLQRARGTNTEINMCSWGRDGNQTFTYCGDVGTFENSTIIPKPNPSFNDIFGAPTTFGDELGTCPLPLPSVSVEEPTINPSPDEQVPFVFSSPTTQGTSLASSPSAVVSPSLSASPSMTSVEGPSQTEETGQGNTCFPCAATVVLMDGCSKRMDELEIGDEVQVGPTEFSPVFIFTHKKAKILYHFIKIHTKEGASISLTKDHFLYINGTLEMAKNVKVGDEISLANGSKGSVTRILLQTARGLFNPQTIHGDIVVDGVLTSTYTQAIDPPTAHGLLAPIRFLYRTLSVDAPSLVL